MGALVPGKAAVDNGEIQGLNWELVHNRGIRLWRFTQPKVYIGSPRELLPHCFEPVGIVFNARKVLDSLGKPECASS